MPHMNPTSADPNMDASSMPIMSNTPCLGPKDLGETGTELINVLSSIAVGLDEFLIFAGGSGKGTF